jgi:ubiquitin C-terminal hydrolase
LFHQEPQAITNKYGTKLEQGNGEFSCAESGHSKIDANIEFPDEMDMRPFVVGNGPVGLYQLYAVTEHSGGLAGGHYTAYAVVQPPGEKGEWYYFNDATTRPAKRSEPHSALAHLLFYQRVESD